MTKQKTSPPPPPPPPQVQLQQSTSNDEVEILVQQPVMPKQLVTAHMKVRIDGRDFGYFRQQFQAAERLIPGKPCEAIRGTGVPQLLRMKPENGD